MFESTVGLLAYEWWERVTPEALPEISIIGMRMVLDDFSAIEQLTDITLTVDAASRKTYSALTIKGSDIAAPGYLLGVDSDMPNGTAAGARQPELTDWGYFSTAFDPDMQAFGKAPDSVLTERGVDFAPRGEGFLFRKNPGSYATITYLESNEPRYVFVSIGSALTVKHRPQDNVYFRGTANRTARRAIIHALYNCGYTSGISGITISAIRGIEAALQKGVIVHTWDEGPYHYIETDREVLKVPVAYELSAGEGDLVEPGDNFIKEQKPSFFAFPMNGISYGVSGELADASLYPGIRTTFPELQINSFGQFSTEELYNLLLKYGILPLDIRGTVDAGAARALAQYAVQDSQICLQQYATVQFERQIRMSASPGAGASVTASKACRMTLKVWNFI